MTRAFEAWIRFTKTPSELFPPPVPAIPGLPKLNPGLELANTFGVSERTIRVSDQPSTLSPFNGRGGKPLRISILHLKAMSLNRTWRENFRLTLCLAAACLIPVAVRAQQTPEWQPQSSGTSQVLLGVAFTDATKGYAVGTSGVIRVTANGGNTWAAQSSGTSRFLRDVYFSDATHGTIVGESGLILRTTDGTNWTTQTSGTVEHLVHVNFLDNNAGIACGQGGVILKTTNGGANWTPQSSDTTVELPGVDLIDANTAIAVGFGGTILRTTNGGDSWTKITVPGFTLDLRSVHFWGPNGVAVSMGGGILKSQDAGQSWTVVSSGTASNLFAVQFRNANTVYAVGNASVRVTTDAGMNWTAATTTPFAARPLPCSVQRHGRLGSWSERTDPACCGPAAFATGALN